MTTTPLTLDIPAGLPFIHGERWFDAPVELVWRAYTEPDLVARWQGPDRLVTTIGEWDLRPGGAWSHSQRDPATGDEYGFRGVVHDVVPRETVTQTFEFLGMPGHVSLETLWLEEVDGRTRMRLRSVFQSVEDRDGMVASGMEGGMTEGYERLDELLAGAKV